MAGEIGAAQVAEENAPRTRDRLLDAAIELFATHGYARTSVGSIQAAAGLTAGSGALYKHYSSKNDLLTAVIDHHIGYISRVMDAARSGSADPFEDLETAARFVLDGLSENRNLLRIIFRELEEGPGLDRLWEVIEQNVFCRFAQIIRDGTAAGVFRDIDADATATLLVSALSYMPTVRDLIGKSSPGYDRERHFELWRRMVHALLTP
ncbi:TetR/AcrR family transcriptional regulator [Nocardia sp. R16R-3T]